MFFNNSNTHNALQVTQNIIASSAKESSHKLQSLLFEKMAKKIAIISLMLLSIVATVVIYKRYLKRDSLPKRHSKLDSLPKKISIITKAQARDNLIKHKGGLVPAYYEPYAGYSVMTNPPMRGHPDKNDNMPYVLHRDGTDQIKDEGNEYTPNSQCRILVRRKSQLRGMGIFIPLDANVIREEIRSSQERIAKGRLVDAHRERIAIWRDALEQIDRINQNFNTLLRSVTD